MKIRKVMRPWVKVHPESTVSELAKILDNGSTGSALVVDAKDPIGIVTERDILRKIVVLGKDPKETKVKYIMSPNVITIDVNETVSKASDVMADKGVRHIVVVENGKIAGKITTNIISLNYRYRIGRSISRRIPYYGKLR